MKNTNIGVIGLGYVGLPLAIEFAKHFETVGFDINQERILELKEWTVDNYHRTNAEVRDEVYNRQSKRDPLNRRDSVDAFLQLSQAYRDIIVHTMEHTDSNKINKLKNANNIIEYTTPFDR